VLEGRLVPTVLRLLFWLEREVDFDIDFRISPWNLDFVIGQRDIEYGADVDTLALEFQADWSAQWSADAVEVKLSDGDAFAFFACFEAGDTGDALQGENRIRVFVCPDVASSVFVAQANAGVELGEVDEDFAVGFAQVFGVKVEVGTDGVDFAWNGDQGDSEVEFCAGGWCVDDAVVLVGGEGGDTQDGDAQCSGQDGAGEQGGQGRTFGLAAWVVHGSSCDSAS
jgi:hypothetical protein